MMMLESITPDALRQLWIDLIVNPSSHLLLTRLLVHTVEAKVSVASYTGIDSMDLFVLKGIDLLGTPTLEQLDGVLHLKKQVLRQIVAGLERANLVALRNDQHLLTVDGKQVMATGRQSVRTTTRRVFHLLHPSMDYVPVEDPKGRVLRDLSQNDVPQDWSVSPDLLNDYAHRDISWKRCCGFPDEIVEVVTTNDPSPPSMSSLKAELSSSPLIVVKTQTASCAMVLEIDDNGRPVSLVGHGLSPHGRMTTPTKKPFFALREPEAIGRIVKGYSTTPSEEVLQCAWRRLAEEHDLGDAARAICRLVDGRLSVQLPRELVEKWSPFVSKLLQNNMVWICPIGDSLSHIYPVEAVPLDYDAEQAIESLGMIIKLGETIDRGEVGLEPASLSSWLTMHAGTKQISLRELMTLAWKVQKYGVAYRISEVEDMVDATS